MSQTAQIPDYVTNYINTNKNVKVETEAKSKTKARTKTKAKMEPEVEIAQTGKGNNAKAMFGRLDDADKEYFLETVWKSEEVFNAALAYDQLIRPEVYMLTFHQSDRSTGEKERANDERAKFVDFYEAIGAEKFAVVLSGFQKLHDADGMNVTIKGDDGEEPEKVRISLDEAPYHRIFSPVSHDELANLTFLVQALDADSLTDIFLAIAGGTMEPGVLMGSLYSSERDELTEAAMKSREEFLTKFMELAPKFERGEIVMEAPEKKNVGHRGPGPGRPKKVHTGVEPDDFELINPRGLDLGGPTS